MDKKNSRPPETTAPLADTGSLGFCPHWNTAGHLCLLSRDGLFLPVQEHVADFCECSDYPRCPRFRAHADRVTRAVNRRRSVRLPERHLFRFSEISPTEPASGATADEAWTLDLSDHGLRVATTCQLRPETAIHFEVTGNGSPGRAGTGRVVWCQPLANTAFFEIGVALADQPDPTALPRSHRARRA